MRNRKHTVLAFGLLLLTAGCGALVGDRGAVTTVMSSPAAPSREPSRPAPTTTGTGGPQATATPGPSPTATDRSESHISIEGTVMTVSVSAQVLTLKDAVGGFDAVALAERSEIISSGSAALGLDDVLPGTRVEVSGTAGTAGTLLAEQIRVVDDVERLQLEVGTTSASASGRLGPREAKRYLLGGSADQMMRVNVLPPSGEVLLSIWAADGTVLKGETDDDAGWTGPLTATQDYVIEVGSAGEAVNYQLTVVLPVRVAMDAGETSARVKGHLDRHGAYHYVLWAAAGQTMEVVVTATGPQAGLSIVGADGIPLKRYVDEETSWRGKLPLSQHYFIEVVSVEETDYELSVHISLPAEAPSIEVIAPSPGETWVEGETYEVRWRSAGVEKVDIGLALGAKDKGLLADGLDAELERYAWTVPDGFVCGFGVAESSGRVMVTDSGDPAVYGENEGEFTFACPRIQFEPGATVTVVDARSGVWYALGARAGQSLYVAVGSQDEVSIDVVGGTLWLNSDGAPFAAVPSLPSTRDYLIHPVGEEDVSWDLRVAVEPEGVRPRSIEFEPGGTWTTVRGALGAGGDHAGYTLRTSAGQMLAVEVEPTGWAGGIWVQGEDGAVWASAFGESSLTAKLPFEGDTFISLLTPPGSAPVDYALTVSVTP